MSERMKRASCLECGEKLAVLNTLQIHTCPVPAPATSRRFVLHKDNCTLTLGSVMCSCEGVLPAGLLFDPVPFPVMD